MYIKKERRPLCDFNWGLHSSHCMLDWTFLLCASCMNAAAASYASVFILKISLLLLHKNDLSIDTIWVDVIVDRLKFLFLILHKKKVKKVKKMYEKMKKLVHAKSWEISHYTFFFGQLICRFRSLSHSLEHCHRRCSTCLNPHHEPSSSLSALALNVSIFVLFSFCFIVSSEFIIEYFYCFKTKQ